ncbi:VanZ family protein [Paenibacillus durus]|uniref:VanZ-like domain-containing protein n=1 Tax=Paenibacillus durus TaxID=44251 RepID=A0A089HQI5_PAEDU|nr:VanZ family protein [Paenibacillus durus]AIQ12975.1 hypothetical protein PDUR_14425 [Paenibacillus durus]
MDIRFTIEAFPALFILLLVLLAVLVVILQSMIQTKSSPKRFLFGAVMCLYLTSVAYFAFFPIDVNIGIYASQNAWYKSINWIPVLTADVPTFLLNVIMMLPFGFLWPLVSGKTNSWKKAGTAALILSAIIELVQFSVTQTLGSTRNTDINDLIANTLGGIIGYAVLSRTLKASGFRSLLQDGQASSRSC